MAETDRSTTTGGAPPRPVAWFGVTASFHGLIIPDWPAEPAPPQGGSPGLGARLAGILAALAPRPAAALCRRTDPGARAS